MVHTQEHESEIKCPPHKFYKMFKDDVLELPNAMPGTYKGVQVLEGDGLSVGTVRLWSIVLGDDPKPITLKEKLEELDDENMKITFRILDGELMEDYDSFAYKLSVTPKGEGSLVKWCLEYEKKHEHIPHPHRHVDLVALISSHIDGHLHTPEE